MAELVAIVGPSGEGKSTAIGNIPELGIEGLNPKETVIINVSGKPLPFKGWRKKYHGKISEGGNYLDSSDAQVIINVLEFIDNERKDVKNIVFDDMQYIMGFEFMARAKEKGYDKFSRIADVGFSPIRKARDLRSDLRVFCMYHDEVGDGGKRKIKTSGKMIDNSITMEGLFTVVLYTNVTKNADGKIEYKFQTNTDGTNSAKSPFGMFPQMYIPNDLGYVAKQIESYHDAE